MFDFFKKLKNKVVILNMPKGGNKFYYQNEENWLKILKFKKELKYKELKMIFKIAYILGVFSVNKKDSDRATNYILNYVVPYFMNDYRQIDKKIAPNFDFDLHNKIFDKNFAEFFMVYFKYCPDFLTIIHDIGKKRDDLLPEIYKGFYRIKDWWSSNETFTNKDKAYRITRIDLIESWYSNLYQEDDYTLNYGKLVEFKDKKLVQFLKEKAGDKYEDKYWMSENELDLIYEYEKINNIKY